MLYLVSTPIGNLEDITLRALRILKECDYILCEDSRKTIILLNHYKIKKPLFSFHKFNEKQKERMIIEDLQSGKNIAVVSDAGTPIICDPGNKLVQECIKKDILFTLIPGPCSVINGLVLSGFDLTSFHFFGFLEKKDQEIETALQQALRLEGVSCFFESPSRIIKTLKKLESINPNANIAIAKEITKKFENVFRGTVTEVLTLLEEKPIKGELILMIEGGNTPVNNDDIEGFIKLLQNTYGLSIKDAIKMAAKLKKVPKKTIYKKILC